MAPTTCFTDAAAVVAWDSQFRWRTPDGLLDRTIDATWWRVANAITGSSNEMRLYAHRYVDAFSRWRLLPDERLLRFAGTGRSNRAGLEPSASPRATLNVARFVVPSRTSRAYFDVDDFRATAALAVRLLDDVLISAPSGPAMQPDLRIGLMGFDDALALLGLTYTDPAAIHFAHLVGATLAAGALQGSVEMARERGPLALDMDAWMAQWRRRGMPKALIEGAMRDGIRHCRLTAIESQPCLALFANNASDALYPAMPRATPAGPPGLGMTTLAARLAIRGAMQGWIDAPIDDPLPEAGGPQLAACRATDGIAVHPTSAVSR